MNYSQTLEFLFTSLPAFETKGATAYKPGLERIAAFCKAMGNPQRNFFTIHVAGTNGKGSVSHLLASVLQQAGYRTGLYTSPHLQDFRERIRVDGEMIPKQKVVNFVDKHHDKMVELGLSFFEMSTAMAFDYFAQSDVEVAVIETGLGGRLDATNVIVPVLSVITNVGLEHTDLLGDTLQKIAAEKGGIIKKSIPVVIGEEDDRYNSVFDQLAATNKSKVVYAQREIRCEEQIADAEGFRQRFRLQRMRDGRIFELEFDLAGEYQRRNIVTATAAIDFLHEETPLTISRRAFIAGVRDAAANTSLHGRWEKLADAPLTVCDTGHNAHGIACVAEQLKKTAYKKLYCVIGFVKDKDLAHILPLLPHDAHYIFTQAQTSRALPAADLAAKAAIYGLQGEMVETVEAAIRRAQELAQPDDMIFIGGSTYVVAEASVSDHQ
ncbi:MAG: bifunctional folylpolyglutamate synthase/dihydrofolate synthase [Alistipes sp.]|nr:bifunctional folylpolyglutamate synthase/dihydrofolate synthase [Alistipes sp.]